MLLSVYKKQEVMEAKVTGVCQANLKNPTNFR